MKKKVIKIILLLAFISVFRYIGLYICIDNGNLQLLKVMSYLHDNHYELWEKVYKECF